MCGIAGLATRGGLRDGDAALVDHMLGVLAHRGPDDQHQVADDYCAIGARRLSIIDLDLGRQPLTDESGGLVATQNGEIYNYVELRDDLLRSGHVFRTNGDTETIVHLYEEHGTGFVKLLRGMFAIAIWDTRNRRLVLARDRLGKKPLYWRLSDDRLTYGSELKAILANPETPLQVDRQALDEYLQYQYVPAPRTILRGINKLPPASVLVWDGGDPRIERYWTPEYTPKLTGTLDEHAEQGLTILRDAVRLRLRSDVPVGVFLSGGMDSSVVTALMAETSAQPVRTFSIGFDDRAFDELPYARAVAQHFGAVHTEEVVRLDAIGLLPELTDHFDEPFGDSSAIPTFRVAQMAAQSLKVVLTGDGGDESFGGYLRYRLHQRLGALDAVPRPMLRTAARAGWIATAPLGSGSRFRRRLRIAETLFGAGDDVRYVRQMTAFDAPARQRLLRDGERSDRSSEYLLSVLRAGPSQPLDRLLRADLLTYLPEDLLVKVDRATMANSLEARAPLLDHELVEFAARLPIERKMAGGATKVLLRTIARQLMPPRFVERPKMGFGVPIADWFRGPLGDRFEETVLVADAAVRDHLDVSVARTLLAEHRTGLDHSHRLWMLLMFELWARRWLPAPARLDGHGPAPTSAVAGGDASPGATVAALVSDPS